MILFIKCTPAATTNTLFPQPELEARIRSQIASDLSRRHVPELIFEAPNVPYNANGKKLEIQVKAIVGGGSQAKKKLTITKEEISALEWFEPFYDVEKLLEQAKRVEAKL